MSDYAVVHEDGRSSRSARRARDPLQIPISLTFDEDRPFPRIREAVRGTMLWLAVVVGAAVGVLFAGAAVPELKAAAHAHAQQTRATAETAPSAVKVCEP